MSKHHLGNYLQQYAEPESRELPINRFSVSYDVVLAIPAYRESTEFLSRLYAQRFLKVNKLLLVLVSNHPTGLVDDDAQLAIQSHEALEEFLPAPQWSENQISFHPAEHLDTILVARTGDRALDSKQATGLARKIGVDIGARFVCETLCRSKWIFNTDADTSLPPDFFSAMDRAEQNTVAMIYPFRHIGGTRAVQAATELYERKLNYHVKSLTTAGSPYAFHSLGSVMIVEVNAYAKVRGFPKRIAGEDFYLLNKLAKVGRVMQLTGSTVDIFSRNSDRVPFGTGPAIQKIMDQSHISDPRIFYHPKIYELLSFFIDHYSKISECNTVPKEINEVCEYLQWDLFLAHSERQKLNAEQFKYHFHSWFDGFKTLKFIHFMRDRYYPNVDEKELQQFTLKE